MAEQMDVLSRYVSCRFRSCKLLLGNNMLTFLEQLARLHSSWKQMILVIQSIKGVNAIFHLQFLFFFFPSSNLTKTIEETFL